MCGENLGRDTNTGFHTSLHIHVVRHGAPLPRERKGIASLNGVPIGFLLRGVCLPVYGEFIKQIRFSQDVSWLCSSEHPSRDHCVSSNLSVKTQTKLVM